MTMFNQDGIDLSLTLPERAWNAWDFATKKVEGGTLGPCGAEYWAFRAAVLNAAIDLSEGDLTLDDNEDECFRKADVLLANVLPLIEEIEIQERDWDE